MAKKKTKWAKITMLETHRVVYDIEVDAKLSESQVEGMANRMLLDLDDGLKVEQPDWDCEEVEFENEDD